MIAGLAEHVTQARWFGGKGRGGELTGMQPLAWMSLRDDLAVRPEVITWRYPDGTVEYYQVLVAYRDQELPDALLGEVTDAPDIPAELRHAHDATRDPEAMRAVVRGLLRGSRDDASWTAVLSDARKISDELEPRVFGGQQSNTNVLLGDVAIVKVFRKLEPGHNLDIQVHDALARSGDVASAAKLYGWVTGSFDSPSGARVDSDLMMIVEQLRDASDGFDMARQACAEGVDFTAHAKALGEALAEVHLALEDTFPTSTLDGTRLAEQMERRLDAAIGEAPILEPHRAGLVAAFQKLAGRKVLAQRIHGDFHLQQTLHTPSGWRIIDFEGEPMKTLAERQAPDSPWRDVAGMVRSIGYATSGSDDPTGPAAQQWFSDVRDAFLGGYCGRVTAEQAELLAAYEADKAAYEVVYEVRNRPDWLPIPMTALQAIAPVAESAVPTSAPTASGVTIENSGQYSSPDDMAASAADQEN